MEQVRSLTPRSPDRNVPPKRLSPVGFMHPGKHGETIPVPDYRVKGGVKFGVGLGGMS